MLGVSRSPYLFNMSKNNTNLQVSFRAPVQIRAIRILGANTDRGMATVTKFSIRHKLGTGHWQDYQGDNGQSEVRPYISRYFIPSTEQVHDDFRYMS